MRMADENEKKYKDCCLWLKYDLPFLPKNKPKVWAAFTRRAPSYARYVYSPALCILWGHPPTLKIENSRMMTCEDVGDPELQRDGSYIQKRQINWYGFTVPTYDVDEIYISRDIAENAIGPDSLVLEATVLHELIHWCRKKAFVKDFDDEEAPRAFEKEAYGRIVLRTWNVCYSQPYFKVE
jgi:Metallopeptidase toxin 3